MESEENTKKTEKFGENDLVTEHDMEMGIKQMCY
jgi:hypothetical protein